MTEHEFKNAKFMEETAANNPTPFDKEAFLMSDDGLPSRVSPTPDPKGEWTDGGKTWIGYPEPKPDVVTWKRFDLQIIEHPYSSSSVRMIETVNGTYALHSEAAATIARLTTERDAAVNSEFATNVNAASSVKAERQRAEAAERERDRWHRIAMDAGVITHTDGTTSHPMRAELATLREQVAAKDRALAKIDAVTVHSGSYYCRYISKMESTECLGWEAKARTGVFGINEFNAHAEANRLLGYHQALSDLRRALSAREGK